MMARSPLSALALPPSPPASNMPSTYVNQLSPSLTSSNNSPPSPPRSKAIPAGSSPRTSCQIVDLLSNTETFTPSRTPSPNAAPKPEPRTTKKQLNRKRKNSNPDMSPDATNLHKSSPSPSMSSTSSKYRKTTPTNGFPYSQEPTFAIVPTATNGFSQSPSSATTPNPPARKSSSQSPLLPTLNHASSASPRFTSPEVHTSIGPSTLVSPAASLSLSRSSSHLASSPAAAPISAPSSYISHLASLELQMRSKQPHSTTPTAPLSAADSYISQLKRLETVEVQKTRASSIAEIDTRRLSSVSSSSSSSSSNGNNPGSINKEDSLSLLPAKDTRHKLQFHQQFLDMCVPCLSRTKEAGRLWASMVPQLSYTSDPVHDSLLAYTMISMERYFGDAKDSSWAPLGKLYFDRCLSHLKATMIPETKEMEEIFVSIVLLVHYAFMRPNAVPLLSESRDNLDFFCLARTPYNSDLFVPMVQRKSQYLFILDASDPDALTQDKQLATYEYFDMLNEFVELAANNDDICMASLFFGGTTPLYTSFLPDEKEVYLDAIRELNRALYLSVHQSTCYLLRAFTMVSDRYYEFLRARRPVALVIASYMLSIFVANFIGTSGGIFGQSTSQLLDCLDQLEGMMPAHWSGAVYWSRQAVEGKGLDSHKAIVEQLRAAAF